MSWGLQYILQGLNPNTFEEMATCVHDIKVSITTRGDQWFPTYEVCKDEDIEKYHSRGNFAFENEFEEFMYVSMFLNEPKLQVKYP